MVIKNEIKNTQPKSSNSKTNKDFSKNPNDKNNLAYHYYFVEEDQCYFFLRHSCFSPDGKIYLLVSEIMKNPKIKMN